MRNGRYGVLVHGAGWVSTQHIAAFQNNSATEVVALSSRSRASAQRRAVEAGLSQVAIYDDFEAALRHEGVDVVSICTPQHVHCQNVLAAARAGKHMVIEKPVGISVAELRAMRQAVQAAGVKTVVSFVLRWNPLFRTLKTMIADGALGKVYYVEADYLSHNGSWWSGWRDTCTAKNGVSAFLVAGCHAVDALRWFAAEGEFAPANPLEVFAVSGGYRKGRTREFQPQLNSWIEGAPPMEYDGLEVALVKFDNAVLGKVSVNFDCIMPYRFPIRIFGERGSVLDNRVWAPGISDKKDWIELAALAPDSTDVAHHPFQGEIDHFVTCLRQDRESHCNLEDALKTHEVVFAARQCYATGRPVKLPLAG
jgi:predicted dehydrogenase